MRSVRRHRSFVLAVVSSALLSGSGRSPAQVINPGDWVSPKDREKSLSRLDKATKGATLDDFVKRLGSPDPEIRKQAVESLGGLDDPKATDRIITAVEDPDPRVSAKALEILGKKRVTSAADFLTQRLFFAGTSDELRRRMLQTLGQIGDPASAPSILDFARTTTDRGLRAQAIGIVGDIGDSSMRPGLEGLAGGEQDPELRRLIAETESKVAARRPAQVRIEGAAPKNP